MSKHRKFTPDSLARSSYYYQPGAGDDAEIEATIEQVTEQWPKYGSRLNRPFSVSKKWGTPHGLPPSPVPGTIGSDDKNRPRAESYSLDPTQYTPRLANPSVMYSFFL